MLHEKPVQYVPLGDEGDGAGGSGWTGEKRHRRKYPPHPASSSSSSDGTAQGTISHDEADMEGITQDHEPSLLPRSESEQRQEEEEEEEEHWGPELVISPEEAAEYNDRLDAFTPTVDTRSMMAPEEREELALRLARYRIAYYKNVGDPELASELKDPKDFSVEELQQNHYFLDLESHRGFEGCFHPQDTWVAELDDYQRLLVYNGPHDSCDFPYIAWHEYHAYYRTYHVDEDYVNFYRELSSKVKWLKKYLHLDPDSQQWKEMRTIAARQAMKIASNFTNLSSNLAGKAFYEYISELRKDKDLEDLSLFYFEVWKLDALKKGSLRDAVQKAYEMPKFAVELKGMSAEMNARAISIHEQKFRFLTREGGINESTEEDEACELLRRTVFKKFKQKNMAKYAEKKLEIAKLMNMKPKSDSRSSEMKERREMMTPTQILGS